MQINVTKALVLLTNTADKIYIFTDLPCPYVKAFLPSQEPLALTFEATYDTGIQYVKDVFGIEPEITVLRH